MSSLKSLTWSSPSWKKSLLDSSNTSTGSTFRWESPTKGERCLSKLEPESRIKTDHRIPPTKHVMTTSKPTNVRWKPCLPRPLSSLKTLVDILRTTQLSDNELCLRPLIFSLVIVIHEVTKLGSSTPTSADMKEIRTEPTEMVRRSISDTSSTLSLETIARSSSVLSILSTPETRSTEPTDPTITLWVVCDLTWSPSPSSVREKPVAFPETVRSCLELLSTTDQKLHPPQPTFSF